MGSQAVQRLLWGKQAEDWASIQEKTGTDGYEYALDNLKLTPDDKVLDVGCGSGMFCGLALSKGADTTGIDATTELIEQAKNRYPSVKFMTGEMEELPFEDNTFDIVCGFNSFQYASDIKNALAEAKRVLKPGGQLAVMIWGNKEDCEAASYLKAVGSLMPPPPPGAPGPFALSENQRLENILQEVGFTIIENEDVPALWDYPDTETALKGLLSAGPVARVIEHTGFEKVYEIMLNAIQPYVQSNGHVIYKNKWRIVISEK